MTEPLAKTYDPAEVEPRIYARWEKAGVFAAPVSPGKPRFAITIPPPNVTGELHMGHALQHAIHDAIVRRKRMQGYVTLCLPGTDHASIATQLKVEQQLRAEGLTRWDLGRERFLERCWEWTRRYGGTLLELKYRTRKVQKPRLLLICDVSASMARYAVFVIQFIYGLSNVIRNIESFIFSEDLERVTPYFRNGSGFAETMSKLMNQSGQWGRATNLHTSLTTFLGSHQHLLAPDVFVIIVSDTKTLDAPEAARDLKEIRGRVRDVIWLNTLPRKEWKELPAVLDFQKYCRMFECYTLAHLNKVLRGQMLTA